MEEKIPIIRCPNCGSVHLNAKYSSITKRKTGFAELLSFRYAIKVAEGKNKPTLYWECKECKKTFPMTSV